MTSHELHENHLEQSDNRYDYSAAYESLIMLCHHEAMTVIIEGITALIERCQEEAYRASTLSLVNQALGREDEASQYGQECNYHKTQANSLDLLIGQVTAHIKGIDKDV